MSASEFWNERYQIKDYLFGVEPNDFIKAVTPKAAAVNDDAPPTAYAPADGEGRNGVFLARMGYQVTTVDVANLAVDKALALAEHHGVALDAHVGDVFTHPVPEGHFDIVTVCFMHFMPDDHQRFMTAMKAALKPGGLFIMEAYTRDQIPLSSGGPKNPDMMMSAEQLAGEFADFDIELLQETRRLLSEGPRHQGEAATVQLLARKT
ncbi:MAG: class I SAM-dependent methyltransferase [Alphaproteobacteria bacterium]|nr:class I SAM-dependent methyltransferase [Alphaproteobacteria bacterium]